jgi:hypothetical protein
MIRKRSGGKLSLLWGKEVEGKGVYDEEERSGGKLSLLWGKEVEEKEVHDEDEKHPRGERSQ